MTTDDSRDERDSRSQPAAEEELEVLLAQYIDILNGEGHSAARLFLKRHEANTALQELAQSARDVRGLFVEELIRDE